MYDILVMDADDISCLYAKDKKEAIEIAKKQVALRVDSKKSWVVRVLTGPTLVWEDSSRARR